MTRRQAHRPVTLATLAIFAATALHLVDRIAAGLTAARLGLLP